jgi:hypothetical protein
MHTDEKNAIRYLLKEMDPSEEMEFEKLMREDEDLLIEVESLRATKRRLSGLSLKNPPQSLTQKITNDAKQLQSERLRKNKDFTFFLKRGMAAAILLSVFIGGGYFYYNDTPKSVIPATSATGTIEPWVDRNEVLRFSEGPKASESSSSANELTRSYDKLELVNDPSSSVNGGNGIMLTGSSD